MKILITEPLSQEGLRHLEEQQAFRVRYLPSLSEGNLEKEIADAVALIIRGRTRVHSSLLQQASRLRVIGRAGAGVDNIDLEAATRRGVVVMNTPGGNSVSVAEHTFALLTALVRKIPFAHLSVLAGEWRKSDFTGQELRNKVLGLVGLGKIGSLVAQRALAFDMKVLAYDPFVTEKYASDLGATLLSLEDLLQQSDFVSLHLPLNEKTRGLIGRQTLELMKPGAALINTARGGLVVEEELARSLREGRLAGAALDVFEKEPKIHPELLKCPNVIFTPHIGGSTVEAQLKVGFDIAQQVSNFLLHDIIVNAVNFPSVSSKELEQLLPYMLLGEKLGSFLSQISQMRISEIGIRYYGDLTRLNCKPVSNYILKGILRPMLSEEINEVNARNYARERGISVIETSSSRERSYSNLISLQLRSPERTEWVEGAILRQGNLRLVSVDGIPVETQLGNTMLFIRNLDKPGVIGQVGTILGESHINIASFVLGRAQDKPYAVGVVNTDGPIPPEVLEKIRRIPAVQYAQVVHL